MGVFKGLHDFFRGVYEKEYEFMITEIALNNIRSLAAHKKQGFEEISRDKQGEVGWSIVVWPWREFNNK